MSEREAAKPSFTPTPKRKRTAEDLAAGQRYAAQQKEYDLGGTALARSKEGMPLTAAQQGALNRIGQQHKRMRAGRAMSKR